MDMNMRNYGPQPTFMGRGTIGTSRLNVYEAIQAMDWGAVFDAGYAIDFSSSSVSDAAAGTGARTLTIYGLDNDGNPINEVITLNGQTKGTGTKLFWRVFCAQVSTAGSGRANAGDIYLYKTGTGGTITAGVPGTLTGMAIKIPIGDNFGSSGVWTAPRGTSYTLDQVLFSCRAQAGKIEVVHAGAKNNPVLLPYVAISHDIGIGNVAWSEYHMGNDFILNLKEKEDIYFRASMAAASGIISFVAKMQILTPTHDGL